MFDLSEFRGKQLYLDANVFIYAIEGFPPHDRLLKALFTMIDERSVQASTSEITLAEVFVMPMRQEREDLLAIYRGLLIESGSIELIPVNRAVLVESAAVRARSSAKPIDAIYIASAAIAECDFFISDDRRLNPAPLRKLSLEELASG